MHSIFTSAKRPPRLQQAVLVRGRHVQSDRGEMFYQVRSHACPAKRSRRPSFGFPCGTDHLLFPCSPSLPRPRPSFQAGIATRAYVLPVIRTASQHHHRHHGDGHNHQTGPRARLRRRVVVWHSFSFPVLWYDWDRRDTPRLETCHASDAKSDHPTARVRGSDVCRTPQGPGSVSHTRTSSLPPRVPVAAVSSGLRPLPALAHLQFQPRCPNPPFSRQWQAHFAQKAVATRRTNGAETCVDTASCVVGGRFSMVPSPEVPPSTLQGRRRRRDTHGDKW